MKTNRLLISFVLGLGLTLALLWLMWSRATFSRVLPQPTPLWLPANDSSPSIVTAPPPTPGEADRATLGSAETEASTGTLTIPPPPADYGGPVILQGPTVSEPVVPHVFDGDLRDLPSPEPKPGPPREIPLFPLHGKTPPPEDRELHPRR